MYEATTVTEAIDRGRRMINYPVGIIQFTVIIGSIFVVIFFNLPGWLVPVGILIGFIASWLYWSFVITQWRIWAFENVRNVHELKQRAIKEKLIWKDGSIFGKTEIRTAADKEKLQSLESKFLQNDVFVDDSSVPDETVVYYSKTKNFLQMGIMLIAMFGGIYLLAVSANYLAGGLLTAFGAFFSIKEYLQATNTTPQIILNSRGIETVSTPFYEWKDITDDEAVARRTGKSTNHYLNYNYPNGSEQLKIDDYEISQRELDNLLRVYRGRYNNKKPSP